MYCQCNKDSLHFKQSLMVFLITSVKGQDHFHTNLKKKWSCACGYEFSSHYALLHFQYIYIIIVAYINYNFLTLHDRKYEYLSISIKKELKKELHYKCIDVTVKYKLSHGLLLLNGQNDQQY